MTFEIADRFIPGDDPECREYVTAPGVRIRFDGGWRAWVNQRPVTNEGGNQICWYDWRTLARLGFLIETEPEPPEMLYGQRYYGIVLADAVDAVSAPPPSDQTEDALAAGFARLNAAGRTAPKWREQCQRCGARWAGPTTPLPTDSLGRKVCPPFDAANCDARTEASRGPRNDFAVFAAEFSPMPDGGEFDAGIRRPSSGEPLVNGLAAFAEEFSEVHEIGVDVLHGLPAEPVPCPTTEPAGFWHNVVAHPLLVLWPRLGRWLHDRTAP